MTLLRFTLAIAILLVGQLARADEPLPPPQKVVVCSTSGEICAESDPRAGRTVVIRKSGRKPLWSIKDWHRSFFVSDDGQSLVVAHDGLGLVPTDSDLRLEVLHFYAQGKLVRSISLGDLYTDRAQLVRTASHLAWMNFIEVNRAGQLVVALVTGRDVALSMKTGLVQRLEEAPSSESAGRNPKP